MRLRDLWDAVKILASCPIGLIFKLFKRNIWMVSEMEHSARDTGYWFFKYMRENYPGAEVYVVFEPPVRACLYGDYRTREEAEAVMYRLRATRKFKEIAVRKSLINLPY